MICALVSWGSSQHCWHAIGYAEEHLDLDRARVGSIVLILHMLIVMSGLDDLAILGHGIAHVLQN